MRNCGFDAVDRILEHTGENITRRLRSHLANEINRHIDAKNSLEQRIAAVLNGENTYNPRQQKPIARHDAIPIDIDNQPPQWRKVKP